MYLGAVYVFYWACSATFSFFRCFRPENEKVIRSTSEHSKHPTSCRAPSPLENPYHSVHHPTNHNSTAFPTHCKLHHSTYTPPQIQPQQVHITVNSTTARIHHHKFNYSAYTSLGTKLQHIYITRNTTKAYSHNTYHLTYT